MKYIIIAGLSCFIFYSCKGKDNFIKSEESSCNLSIVKNQDSEYALYFSIGISRYDSIANENYLKYPESRIYFNDKLHCIAKVLEKKINISSITISYYDDFCHATDITQIAIEQNFTEEHLLVDDARPFVAFLDTIGYFDQIKSLLGKYSYKINLIAAERVPAGKFKGRDGNEGYYPIGIDQLIFHISRK